MANAHNKGCAPFSYEVSRLTQKEAARCIGSHFKSLHRRRVKIWRSEAPSENALEAERERAREPGVRGVGGKMVRG